MFNRETQEGEGGVLPILPAILYLCASSCQGVGSRMLQQKQNTRYNQNTQPFYSLSMLMIPLYIARNKVGFSSMQVVVFSCFFFNQYDPRHPVLQSKWFEFCKF